MAEFYAKRHKKIDSGILQIHYLPTEAPANEIRFVEVNNSITGTASPEPIDFGPIDFGVAGGTVEAHRLIVLDVTPEQWQEIQQGTLQLPPGWTLTGSQEMNGSAIC
jgi:hypothetical protein